jgi:hypothetical protein
VLGVCIRTNLVPAKKLMTQFVNSGKSWIGKDPGRDLVGIVNPFGAVVDPALGNIDGVLEHLVSLVLKPCCEVIGKLVGQVLEIESIYRGSRIGIEKSEGRISKSEIASLGPGCKTCRLELDLICINRRNGIGR